MPKQQRFLSIHPFVMYLFQNHTFIVLNLQLLLWFEILVKTWLTPEVVC